MPIRRVAPTLQLIDGGLTDTEPADRTRMVAANDNLGIVLCQKGDGRFALSAPADKSGQRAEFEIVRAGPGNPIVIFTLTFPHPGGTFEYTADLEAGTIKLLHEEKTPSLIRRNRLAILAALAVAAAALGFPAAKAYVDHVNLLHPSAPADSSEPAPQP